MKLNLKGISSRLMAGGRLLGLGLLTGIYLVAAVTCLWFFLGLIVPGITIATIHNYYGWSLAAALIALAATVAATGKWRQLFSGQARTLYLWAGAVLATAIDLFYSVENWRGRRAWAACAATAAQQGYPLRLEAIWPKPAPAAQDFAQTPVFAPLLEKAALAQAAPDVKLEAELGNWLGLPRPAGRDLFYPWWMEGAFFNPSPWLAACQQQTAGPGYPPSNRAGMVFPENLEIASTRELARGMTSILGQCRVDLDGVREASQKPWVRFPIHLERRGMGAAAFPSIMADLGHALSLRALARLYLNQTEEALADSAAARRLAELNLQIPCQFTYHYSCRMVLESLQPVWEGLAKESWSDDQLAALEKQLEAMDWMQHYPAAFRNDQLFFIDFWNQLFPATPAQPAKTSLASVDEEWALKVVRLIYPRGWSYQNQAGIGRQLYAELDKPWAAGQPIRPPAPLGNPRFFSLDPVWMIFMAPKVNEHRGDCLRSFALVQTALSQARLACALERHRHAKGSYPADLTALQPTYMTSLPGDPCAGQPMRYRLSQTNRFVVYAIGWNQQDDGGIIATNEYQTHFNPNEGDWAWRYPEAVLTKKY